MIGASEGDPVAVGLGSRVPVGVGVAVAANAHEQLAIQPLAASTAHNASQRTAQQKTSSVHTHSLQLASLQLAVSVAVQQSPGVGVGVGGPAIDSENDPSSLPHPSTAMMAVWLALRSRDTSGTSL